MASGSNLRTRQVSVARLHETLKSPFWITQRSVGRKAMTMPGGSCITSAAIALAVLAAASGQAVAQERLLELPLANLSSRLPATAAEGRKAIDQQAYGVVAINQRSLALPVAVAEATDERLKVHTEVFDYYFLPVSVGVAGLGGSQVRSFLIEFSLPERRVENSDVWIVDVFPRIETAAGRLTADTELEVSTNLEFKLAPVSVPAASAGAKIDGRGRVGWKYNPVFQSFAAVFSEATAIWNFDRVGDELKAGPIDLRLLIAVRKDGQVARDKRLPLKSRISARFTGGSLFSGRSASAEATIEVGL